MIRKIPRNSSITIFFESLLFVQAENLSIKNNDRKKIIINIIVKYSKEIILNFNKGYKIIIEIKDPNVPGQTLKYPEKNNETKILVNIFI